jgi:putative transposase
VLYIVKPATVVAWRRRRFRAYWARLSGRHVPGRPVVAKEIQALIRQISAANVTWGSPRIKSELHMLGIEIAKSTIARYMVQRPLANHVPHVVSIDFFLVSTVRNRNRILYVFLVLAHLRRRVVHFGITEHPTAAWTSQQLIEAFSWDTAPHYLIRDRDSICGGLFRRRVAGMNVNEVPIAPRSPWQSPTIERLIGSLRRECLDHVVVLGAQHLRYVLTSYLAYYHQARCHIGLDGAAPVHREPQPPALGKVIELPEVGGLHHHYERRAA